MRSLQVVRWNDFWRADILQRDGLRLVGDGWPDTVGRPDSGTRLRPSPLRRKFLKSGFCRFTMAGSGSFNLDFFARRRRAMAVRCVSWLAIGVVCGLAVGRLADGQEAPAKGDQPADAAAPAKGAAAERPPFFEFPKEKVVEIEKDCNKFKEGEPTKDD